MSGSLSVTPLIQGVFAAAKPCNAVRQIAAASPVAECKQQRYVVAKSTTATLDFAAVMADAARLYKPYEKDYPGFTAQAAEMAERAYEWAKQNPRAMYNQNALRDPAVTTGTYSDFNTRDEFFWAASALYRLTGKQQYMEDARQYMPQQFNTPSWGNVSALGIFEWLAPQPW